MNDASRAVGVVSSLLSPEQKPGYVAGVQAEYAKVAEAHRRSEADKQRLPIAKARANAFSRTGRLPAAQAELPRHAHLPHL